MSNNANQIPESKVVNQMISDGMMVSTACHPTIMSPEDKAKYIAKQTKRFTETWRQLQTKD